MVVQKAVQMWLDRVVYDMETAYQKESMKHWFKISSNFLREQLHGFIKR